MKTKGMKAMGAGLALAALLGLAGGCEDAETDTALAVDPSSSETTGKGETVVLTAYDPDEVVYAKASVDSTVSESNSISAQILLPLEWRVSNGGLGRIASSAGYAAIYESYGTEGQNYITVQDQIGRKGTAVVEQRVADKTTNTTTTTETTTVGAETTYVITTNGTVVTTNVVITVDETDEEEDVTTSSSSH